MLIKNFRFIDSIVRQKNQNKHERHSSWTESNKLGQQFIVPNLYANQRVRQRSFSKDPPKPPKLQRDLKKTVAFGLTTTIGDNFNSLRPSTSTSSLYQPNSKLPNNHLHNNRIEANSQLRKDVDQIQKVVKSLIEENVELQACYHENRKLHADVKQLNKTVQELSESNSALMTRVNLLEIWYSRLNENQKRELSTTHLINKKMLGSLHFLKSSNFMLLFRYFIKKQLFF